MKDGLALEVGMSDRGEHDAVSGGVERMAELVMSEQTVQSVLDLIVDLTRTTINVADGASITLRRHDRLVSVATTIPDASTLDDVQTKRGGGPGMQATVDGQTVLARDLSRDERWPSFARSAMDEGFKSVLAIPLNPVSDPIGALVLYSSSVDATKRRSSSRPDSRTRRRSRSRTPARSSTAKRRTISSAMRSRHGT